MNAKYPCHRHDDSDNEENEKETNRVDVSVIIIDGMFLVSSAWFSNTIPVPYRQFLPTPAVRNGWAKTEVP
jgi:hypothetical protein